MKARRYFEWRKKFFYSKMKDLFECEDNQMGEQQKRNEIEENDEQKIESWPR